MSILSEDRPYTTEIAQERALLVGVEWRDTRWPIESSLDELGRLADTAGAAVVGRVTQKLDTPNPKTFIGSGKTEEIQHLVKTLKVDVVIFDDELSPSQQANLENALGHDVKVIDRTALILDIFGMHAKTSEGRVQVQLAQLEYLYPRLRGMWEHLATEQIRGGIGSRFGSGETQLEVDRRLIRKRIAQLKRELKELAGSREVQRKRRHGSPVFRVALAGYTNAGKSTLLNALTGSEVFAHDQLFATLDPTTRKLVLPEGRQVTLTDTVGFIQKLPTTLVESFQSTLAEAASADLILRVTDISSDEHRMQARSVEDVLSHIGAANIATIDVYNKIDLLDEDQLRGMKERYPHAIFVSAQTGDGLDELIKAISTAAAAQSSTLCIKIPFDQGGLSSTIHEQARVINKEYLPDGVRMTVQVPQSFKDQLEPYIDDFCDVDPE